MRLTSWNSEIARRSSPAASANACAGGWARHRALSSPSLLSRSSNPSPLALVDGVSAPPQGEETGEEEKGAWGVSAHAPGAACRGRSRQRGSGVGEEGAWRVAPARRYHSDSKESGAMS